MSTRSTAGGNAPAEEVSAWWHLAALLIFASSAAVVMRGWLVTDLLPIGDFGGYAAVIDSVRDSVSRYGRMPDWNPKWFAGSTNFTSSLKEYASLPVAMLFEPVLATKVMFAVLRVASALLMYGLFSHYFRSPIAGILAGWPYAFGACANHMTRHLDVAFSSIVFPLVLVATVEAARKQTAARWATVGALVGCQFCINYNQAMMASVLVLAVIVAEVGAGSTSWRRVWVSRRWVAHVSIAAVAFLLFAGSQIAWFAFDLQHHALPPRAETLGGRFALSTDSPIVLVNKLGWFNQWIRIPTTPQGFRPGALASQSRYLGIVAIAVTLCGVVLGRHERRGLAWAVAAAVVFFVQYFMSTGPYAPLDQLLAGAKSSAATGTAISTAVFVAGVSCVLLGMRRRSTTPNTRWKLLSLGALLLASRVSVFDIALRVVPPLDSIRSPGHFFDMAPFAFYLLFGLSIVAVDRRLRPGLGRRALWLSIGALVVVDFWPSSRFYFQGTPAAPIREFSTVTAHLPPDLSVRMLFPWTPSGDWRGSRFVEQASILAARAPVGSAASWLPWQAGKHWTGFAERVLDTSLLTATGRGRSDATRSIGRIRYALLPSDAQPPGEPWRRGPANERFGLWIADHVSPMAYATRSLVLIVGDTNKPESGRRRPRAMGMAKQAFTAIETAWARDLRLVTVSASHLAPPTELLDIARLVAVAGDVEPRLPADVGTPFAVHRLPAVRKRAEARWRDLVATLPDDEPIAARYSRPGPARIAIEVDAGDAPAMLFLSEAYHPWWVASVDGVVARVYRAQHAFMGVALTPGAHRVVLSLRPPPFVVAADLATAFAWTATLFVGAAFAVSGAARRVRSMVGSCSG